MKPNASMDGVCNGTESIGYGVENLERAGEAGSIMANYDETWIGM
jgi:hypothetical protein